MTFSERITELSGKNPEHEHLILLAALSVLWLKPQPPEARLLLARYRDRNFPLDALRETALQLFLIAGFQVSLEAAFQIHEVFGRGLEEHDTELADMDAQKWLARGYTLQSHVYRTNVEKLRANLSAISPELEKWTVLVGYGLVLSRDGIPVHFRELIEVAVLAVQGFTRQLHSHLRGALNLNASPLEVELALLIAEAYAGEEAVRPAWRMWHLILSSNMP